MAAISNHRDVAGQGRRVPAWALSVVLHTVIIVLCALMIRGVAPSSGDEPDRRVAIVLAQQGADDSFSFVDDGDEDNNGRGDAATQAEVEAPNQADEQTLPQGEADPTQALFPDIALPGAAAIGGGDADLLSAPSLQISPDTKVLPGLGDGEILAQEAARQRPAGPRGPPSRVSLFNSAPGVGHAFVFIVDRSKSMGGMGALSAVEKELIAVIADLEPNHQFEILAYNNRIVSFSRNVLAKKQLVAATDQNKAKVKEFFGGLAPFGRTEHEMAVKSALYLDPDVVFLLTDGGDPYINDVELSRIHKLAAGAAIHCVQFGDRRRQNEGGFMEKLARQNRGGYGYVQIGR
ncbi:MAG: hypothetical protein QGG36_31660 [Pirellulaceae bacterium]|nr:hypothetical protein [Pirellulaceae bacterium]MDP7020398.1 hypothetical protein [Pirellulaceae bacterium]